MLCHRFIVTHSFAGSLVTNNIKAQSPSPDGKYKIILNFVKTYHEHLDYVYFIFDRCVVARLCQQTRFIVPVESVGADRVTIVAEDSGSHRHPDYYILNKFVSCVEFHADMVTNLEHNKREPVTR